MERARPRNVVIVNTSDAGGGAEQIAMTLLDGFEQLGTNARLVVGRKRTTDPRVIPLHASPHVHYVRDHPLRRARRTARRRLDERLGLEPFGNPYTRLLPEISGLQPDLLLCNNLHGGGYFDLRELTRLSLKMPIVLNLADSWPFTGHCAVPGACDRWRRGCGSCPDLEAPPAIARDATRLNWQRKRWIFGRTRLNVVAPSRWLLDRARESSLAPAIVADRVIPNGLDLTVFEPSGPRASRPEAGTSRLVFAAGGGAANPHKDFATLRSALLRLPGPVELISIGGEDRIETVGDGIRIDHRSQQSPTELAALLRSADAYVHAAPEESFCLTAAEALACGTPVVAACSGGITEVVDNGRTGFLLPPGDGTGLATALRGLLTDRGLRREMSDRAAAAGSRFDRDRMVRDMHEFCREAIEEWER